MTRIPGGLLILAALIGSSVYADPLPEVLKHMGEARLPIQRFVANRKATAPDAAAPVADQVAWWSRDPRQRDVPPPAVALAMLDKCDVDHYDLADVVRWLPHTKPVFDKVFAVYQLELQRPTVPLNRLEYWKKTVWQFLAFNSRYLRNELVVAVQDMKGDTYEEADALKRLDPKRARAIFEKMVDGSVQKAIDLGWTELYSFDPDRSRPHMQILLKENSQSFYIWNAFLAHEWHGDLDWYRELLAGDRVESVYMASAVERQPLRYFPVLETSVQSSTPRERINAVEVLSAVANFNQDPASKRRASLALVPAIADTTLPPTTRRGVLGWSAIPEAAPALLKVATNETGEFRQDALQALASLGTPEALPMIKETVLSGTTNSVGASFLVDALLKAGAFTVDEQVDAITALAGSTPDQSLDMLRLATRTDIGVDMLASKFLDPTVTARVLARPLTPAQRSRILTVLTARGRSPQAALLVTELAQNQVDQVVLTACLGKPAESMLADRTALETLASRPDAVGAVACVLLSDGPRCESLLQNGTSEERNAVLTCARYAELSLSIPAVVRLAARSEQATAQQALAYLVENDSPEARRALDRLDNGWVGRVDDFQPPVFSRLETQILSSRTPGREVFAAMAVGMYSPLSAVVVTADNDSYMVRKIESAEVEWRRPLKATEVAQVRSLWTRLDGDDLPSTEEQWSHPSFGELLHATDRVRRRSFEEYGANARGARQEIVNLFDRLAAEPGLHLHLAVLEQVAGSRLVWSHPEMRALRVQVFDGQLCIQVGSAPLEKGPRLFPFFTEALENIHWIHSDGSTTQGPRKEAIGEPACTVTKEGVAVNGTVVLPGHFIDAVSTPQLDAVAMSERIGEPSLVNATRLVLLQLPSKRRIETTLPAADQQKVITYVQPLRKFLVMRSRTYIGFVDPNGVLTGDNMKGTGPTRPEFYLVDPVTGKADLVTGEFSPLLTTSTSELQPSATPQQCWTALPEHGSTQVGLYRTDDFSFVPRATYPGVVFNSGAMWVDEGERTVYAVSHGRVLSLPLSSASP